MVDHEVLDSRLKTDRFPFPSEGDITPPPRVARGTLALAPLALARDSFEAQPVRLEGGGEARGQTGRRSFGCCPSRRMIACVRVLGRRAGSLICRYGVRSNAADSRPQRTSRQHRRCHRGRAATHSRGRGEPSHQRSTCGGATCAGRRGR